MDLVNSSRMTSTDNWNANSLDVSSLKMNIDNDKMDIIIASPNLVRKDYKLEIINGELHIKLKDYKSSTNTLKSKFILPNSQFTTIYNESFIKGQLKVTLTKKDSDKRKRTNYYNVA